MPISKLAINRIPSNRSLILLILNQNQKSLNLLLKSPLSLRTQLMVIKSLRRRVKRPLPSL